MPRALGPRRRFYTTDFDEMEDLYDLKKHPNLNMDGVSQLLSSLEEFRKDYNQQHFVSAPPRESWAAAGRSREPGASALRTDAERSQPCGGADEDFPSRPRPGLGRSWRLTRAPAPAPPQVRNETFKAAADKLKGPVRKIFVEFLERGCTAEFSG